jgi:2-oxo-4-hydroxy-4-carboxy-5-ureidoimidazoline decarboxylase
VTHTLSAINAMNVAGFTKAFGDVAEHSPWVAERAASARPFADRDAIIDAFAAAMRAATHREQLALIRAHPDLATRARLTKDSTDEQKGAGLDTLNPNEWARFIDLNAQYKKRFGFPFILAVKGATKERIIASFEARIRNDPKAEFDMALTQIARIIRFRLEDRVAP